jgi:hypothetical protein
MQKLSGLNVFIAIFALVLAGALSASRFSVTLTPSLIHRVFFLSKSSLGRTGTATTRGISDL